MESTPPGKTATLASILDTERVLQPARARTLLAELAQATSLPPDPPTLAGWTHQILVSAANGVEHAMFRDQSGAPRPIGERGAYVKRLVDALRAAAIAMLWGAEGTEATSDRRATAEGQPRFPRLHQLLIEQWPATRNTCDSADKFMMFFEATLALDRAAEPKAGREAFKTLSLQALDARKKNVKVGTLGVPFAAIIDTGKFQKAARPAPANAAPSAAQSTAPASEAPPAEPLRVSSPTPSATNTSSNTPMILGVIAAIIVAAVAFFVLKR